MNLNLGDSSNISQRDITDMEEEKNTIYINLKIYKNISQSFQYMNIQ